MALTNLSQVISRIRTQKNWESQHRFLQILECWAEVVGESVAKQSHPVGIFGQVLKVAVGSAVWAQALAFERMNILAKLNAHLMPFAANASALPTLSDIHFSTAKWVKGQKGGVTIKRKVETISKIQDSPSPSLAVVNVPPQDPQEAFRRWQAIVKNQRSHLPKCPVCHCHSAVAELARWQMCQVCARQYFFTVR
jgi:predicted nucleic acid-binding Zn ribbon protein